MSKWKPGTVALVVTSASEGGVGCVSVKEARGEVWSCEHGRTIGENIESVRPLAVIDPYDAEHIERVREGLRAAGAPSIRPVDLAYAIREYASPTPPKPEEPQGLGAVVEDAEGADWHRTRDGRWIAEDGLRSRAAGWAHIDAVRVLSEGVTA